MEAPWPHHTVAPSDGAAASFRVAPKTAPHPTSAHLRAHPSPSLRLILQAAREPASAHPLAGGCVGPTSSGRGWRNLAGSQVPGRCPLPVRCPRKGLEQSRPLGGACVSSVEAPSSPQHLAGGVGFMEAQNCSKAPVAAPSRRMGPLRGCRRASCGDTHPPQGAPRSSAVPQGPVCCPLPWHPKGRGSTAGAAGGGQPPERRPSCFVQGRTPVGSVGEGHKQLSRGGSVGRGGPWGRRCPLRTTATS